ncbi:hypothetical protein OG562_42120 [Streptomyces sp. NBC_01275]|uniref:hypothetical protein n=1 Tax=Streptomyces sp. NBC_01275 TaxID=2903807 RepID=UPI0022563F17|nr:hypothetical protein [Streptomyces sp. NBC_01275]MCX4767436.1 hypothetical protein [Streptomyces sp. NBC_01275]
MSDGAQKSPGYRAVDVVRGYAHRDAIAVRDALAGLDVVAWREMYAVLSGLLRSTVSIIEVTGERWTAGQLVGHADEVAAAAPPHYEFAIAEAARAWARGDPSALSALPGRDPLGAVHVTAVFVAALGLALWGRTGFLGVLTAYDETVSAIVNGQSPGL